MAETKSAWSWVVDVGLASLVGGSLADLAGNLLGRVPYLRDNTLRQILEGVATHSNRVLRDLAFLLRELIAHTVALRALFRQQGTQVQHLETQNQYLEAQNQLLRDHNALLRTQIQHLEQLSGSTQRLVNLMEEQINGR